MTQVRKHYTQFTGKDRQALAGKVKRLIGEKLTPTDHALDRHREKFAGYTLKSVLEKLTLDKVNIIEYSIKGDSERLLFRSQDTLTINGQQVNPCMVVCLTKMVIITIYHNKVDNNHKDSQLTLYDNQLTIR